MHNFKISHRLCFLISKINFLIQKKILLSFLDLVLNKKNKIAFLTIFRSQYAYRTHIRKFFMIFFTYIITTSRRFDCWFCAFFFPSSWVRVSFHLEITHTHTALERARNGEIFNDFNEFIGVYDGRTRLQHVPLTIWFENAHTPPKSTHIIYAYAYWFPVLFLFLFPRVICILFWWIDHHVFIFFLISWWQFFFLVFNAA